MDLADRLHLGELGEDQRDGFLDTAVGVLLDTVTRSLQIAHRHGEEELAAAGLLLQSLERALTE